MAVKSVIDIDVNDGAFARFAATFKQYEAAAAKMPKEWAAVAEQQKKIAGLGKNTVAHMEAQTTLLNKMGALQSSHAKSVAASERSWGNISRFVKQSSATLLDTARNVARWTAYGAAATIGGTLFGLDRMAGTVSSGRKSAMGLGVSYGQQRSFGINYDRLVGNSDQFLSSVNEARLDPTKMGGLLAAGGGSITTGDVANKDPAQLAIQLITALKKKVDTTPDSLLGAIPGASQFGDVAFLKRLKSTSQGELGEYSKAYGTGTGTFDLQEKTQKAFQDFIVRIQGAGEKIENVFVKGLEPLIGPLNELGDSIATSLKTLMESAALKEGIKDLGAGIKTLATYLTSDDFQGDIHKFTDGVGKLVAGIEWIVGKFPSSVTAKVATIGAETAAGAVIGGKLAGPVGMAAGAATGYVGGVLDANKPGTGTLGFGTVKGIHEGRHNPGNIRSWGNLPQSGGFAVFPDDASGVRAIASQLKRYQGRGNDTAEGILNKYAPPGDNNNTEAYIKDVIGKVGIKRDEHLDFNKDPAMLARFVAAITKHEGSKAIPTETVVTILNNTGGNAVVTTSQVAH